MAHRFPITARLGLLLFAFLLVTWFLPRADAFSNGQAAIVVFGQPDYTTNTSATTASGLHFSYGVTIDSTGRLWVADSANNRVLRFDDAASKANGAAADGVLGQPDFAASAAPSPPTAASMNVPSGLAVDSAGRLWVSDASNSRVLRFDDAASKANGAAADGVLGQPNFTTNARVTPPTASSLIAPFGLTIDSAGRLWVSDTANSRVLRFDNAASRINGATANRVLGQSTFSANIGAGGANRMRFPFGVTIDSAGRLWVADRNNHRVLRFDDAASKANGAAADGVLGQSTLTTGASATTANGLNSPYGVTIDSAGRLWVADSANNRMLRFDDAASKANGAATDGVLGQSSLTTSAAATTASGMHNPTGTSLDSAGNLWVADEMNHRILRFDARPAPTITWANPAPMTYGTPLSATQLNATTNVPGTFSYTPPDGTVLNIGAGQTLSVTFTPTDTVNYASATATVTIDVIKATQTITFDVPETRTYGDTGFVLNATASSALPVGFSLISGPATLAGNLVTITGAGTIVVRASQTGDAIYDAAPDVDRSIIIDPAPLTITADDTVKFVNTANPQLSASYSGFVYGDDESSLVPPVSLTTTATTTSPVGTYPITPSGALNPNYAITFVTGTLTITDKQVPSITWADPSPVTYGTALSSTELNATTTVPGTFRYTPAIGTVLDAGKSQSLEAIFTPTDTDTYAVTPVTAHIDVDPAPLTITAVDATKVYGAGLPNLMANATGLVNGDTLATLDRAPTLHTTATASSIVGSYPITATAADANYTITVHDGMLRVTPADLTITADNKIKYVKTANPPLTASYSGFVNGDDESNLVPPVSLITTATITSSAGTYPITPSGALNPNYALTFITGTLTVTAKQVPIITWATPTTIGYGTALGLAQLNATANVPGTFRYVPSTGTMLNAGNRQSLGVVFTPTDADTYTSVSAYVTIDVLRIPLTITADNKTRAIGHANPALTATYIGFVNGDTAVSLDTPAVLSTMAISSSPIGMYPITVSGASDGNYVITFQSGTLTVTQPSIYLPLVHR